MNTYLSNTEKQQKGGTRMSLLRTPCAVLWGWIPQAKPEGIDILWCPGWLSRTILNKADNNATYYEIVFSSIFLLLEQFNFFVVTRDYMLRVSGFITDKEELLNLVDVNLNFLITHSFTPSNFVQDCFKCNPIISTLVIYTDQMCVPASVCSCLSTKVFLCGYFVYFVDMV